MNVCLFKPTISNEIISLFYIALTAFIESAFFVFYSILNIVKIV